MKNYQPISQAIFQALEAAQDILIFSHKNPDGDTLGSSLALAKYLKGLNKNVTCFCLDPLPSNLQFLPNSHSLTNDHLVFTKKYDVIIALDSGSLNYAGVQHLLTALAADYVFINIDHHASNDNYGQINLVLNTASSTAEIIYRLFKDWSVAFDADLATCLACGMITDTSGFKNAATNYLALAAVADLYHYGARLQLIIDQTLKKKELKYLKLWGRALERLHQNKKYQLVYTYITREDFKECEIADSNIEGIANFLQILNEGKIILVLKEDDNNMIRGSMRTNTNIDLARLATYLGGGGHKKASGFCLPGRLECVNNKLKVV